MGEQFEKFRAVVKREFLERVRTRWFLVSTLLGPVFFALITIVPAMLAMRETGSSTVANVTVVDATGSTLGERVVRALADSAPTGARPVLVRVAPAGEAEAERAATQAVVRRERQGVLVLDSATMAGRQARYAGRNASSAADIERLRDVVRREVLAARLIAEGLAPERAQAISAPRLRLATTPVTDRGAASGASGTGNILVGFLVAFLLYMMILLYGQSVLRSVLEEKTTRVAEVIVASVKPDVLMAGKVVGVGAVGLVQTAVWIAGGVVVNYYLMPLLKLPSGAASQAADAGLTLTMPSLGVVVGAVVFFVLGYLLYSALFAAAGSMVSSEQEAQQAAFPVMLPLIASAIFFQVVIRNPESPAAHFVAWFPLTAPIIMPMRMALVSVSPLEVVLVVLGVAVACAAAIWVAARIYRVGLLMYGKRPSVGELVHWVRQAA